MPRGVRREFIDLLARQREHARDRLKLVPIPLILGYVVAELADVPPAGPYVWAYLGLVAVGTPLLFLAASRVMDEVEASIRRDWDAWMAAAPTSGTIPDAAERVTGEVGLLEAAPTAVGLLVLANVAALGMLWFATAAAPLVALAVVVADALAVAAYAAWHLRLLRWAKRFDQAVQEMWRDGEIGVYGGTS